MQILNLSDLTGFSKKHPAARQPLKNWVDITKEAIWKNFSEVKRSFNSADYVKGLVIFDIAGNKYRLIVSIEYRTKRVWIVEIMTHSEYDRWKP